MNALDLVREWDRDARVAQLQQKVNAACIEGLPWDKVMESVERLPEDKEIDDDDWRDATLVQILHRVKYLMESDLFWTRDRYDYDPDLSRLPLYTYKGHCWSRTTHSALELVCRGPLDGHVKALQEQLNLDSDSDAWHEELKMEQVMDVFARGGPYQKGTVLEAIQTLKTSFQRLYWDARDQDVRLDFFRSKPMRWFRIRQTWPPSWEESDQDMEESSEESEMSDLE